MTVGGRETKGRRHDSASRRTSLRSIRRIAFREGRAVRYSSRQENKWINETQVRRWEKGANVFSIGGRGRHLTEREEKLMTEPRKWGRVGRNRLERRQAIMGKGEQ